MEAATASGEAPLARDGAIPAAPGRPGGALGGRHPIDGDARCACCKRFPLVGEQVVRHVGRSGGGWVCEGCERAGRGDRLGAPAEAERVRSLGGAMNVRRAG
jgi:hypothetical protein